MNDIQTATSEQLDALNLNRRSNGGAKSVKPQKKNRTRSEPITELRDISEEQAEAAFLAASLHTDTARLLYHLPLGVAKLVPGDYAKIKTAVRQFEKKYGESHRFELFQSNPKSNTDPIIRRVAVSNNHTVSNEASESPDRQ